ncbi:uncharacterized protein LACBIDRAFT_334089 [Laccaria bicolor S238N-H82]|uniref:Predicted protein n=1 Tax=Laccaria bicolor (strain S238N-H82 / ATCC MYA-4686) TaxID=486041 RepID=B0DY22_LACBS|nr:uncharacterized protein LACBIDRAFT_334089 [Laccaria bicolor S238N-H82]EDR00487.1 predicted protein [Laccaria bicolor S238N-H82]|eukprot:XP_001888879.1 predicted protein [Laccaria bicolor S238N-H82]
MDIPESVQPTVNKMDIDDSPVVEPEPSAPSSPPPPPSNPRCSICLHSQSPGPSSAFISSVHTANTLDDIEEDVENGDDKMPSRSSPIPVLLSEAIRMRISK